MDTAKIAAMQEGRRRAAEARKRAEEEELAADNAAQQWHDRVHVQAYIDLLRLRDANSRLQ
jgi:hypothetical protein